MPELVTWDDVKVPASKIFDIWSSGGDLEWAQEAWAHLTAAGLTSIYSHVDRTNVNLRLMMLGKVYEEFCAARWEENPDRSLEMLAESLTIDRLSLGLLAAKAGYETDREFHLYDTDDEHELYENALLAASAHLRKELFTCLRNAYGDENKLYARLCQTSVGLYPVDDESTEDPFEFTSRNLDAYNAFVTNGFD
jgi:hypothetical protein